MIGSYALAHPANRCDTCSSTTVRSSLTGMSLQRILFRNMSYRLHISSQRDWEWPSVEFADRLVRDGCREQWTPDHVDWRAFRLRQGASIYVNLSRECDDDTLAMVSIYLYTKPDRVGDIVRALLPACDENDLVLEADGVPVPVTEKRVAAVVAAYEQLRTCFFAALARHRNQRGQ